MGQKDEAVKLLGHYEAGTLQPGCLICAKTIPEKQAKFRSKVCSDDCRKALRLLRIHIARIETTPLFCQVCRGTIPTLTAKKLGVVCGRDCRNEMRRYRFQILKTQKCPHCYHPCTPQELEDFRAWRASRGPMQAFFRDAHGRGNQAWAREKKLRDALKQAVSLLKAEMAVVIESYATERMEGLPMRSSVTPDGEAIVAPIELFIEESRLLLEGPKKSVDAEASK